MLFTKTSLWKSRCIEIILRMPLQKLSSYIFTWYVTNVPESSGYLKHSCGVLKKIIHYFNVYIFDISTLIHQLTKVFVCAKRFATFKFDPYFSSVLWRSMTLQFAIHSFCFNEERFYQWSSWSLQNPIQRGFDFSISKNIYLYKW